MQLYISLRTLDSSFHTIILKKKIKEHTYLAAIGYGGGGVYEEVLQNLNMTPLSGKKIMKTKLAQQELGDNYLDV